MVKIVTIRTEIDELRTQRTIHKKETGLAYQQKK